MLSKGLCFSSLALFSKRRKRKRERSLSFHRQIASNIPSRRLDRRASMKRGFLNSKRNAHKEVGPGNVRLNQPIVNDGGNLLGSEPGVPDTVPKFEVGTRPSGLSWAPVSDSLRNRWSAKPTTPWKYTENNQNDVFMDDEDTVATGSTYPSSVEASVASSLATQPLLPHGKMMEAPKAALYDWYLKEHKTQVVGKECYFTWHNEGLPHERMFTSIFVCPVTGEMFATGKYGPRTGIKKRIDSLTRETIEETRVYYEQRLDELTGAQVVWFSTCHCGRMISCEMCVCSLRTFSSDNAATCRL